jgi:serine/threonine protein kinase
MQPIPFGKYLLVERLAQGGMAEVFRAVFSGAAGFEKQVALKRILPIFDGAQDFVSMFVDEARIASSLTHVNVVQVFDFGEHDGSYYLAMELIDGVDLGRLREAAARRGLRLPVAVAAFIVAEAARGLAYAHDKRGPDGAPLGIVHRDVSPHNVLVSYAGEVKIADFGIAKATGKLHKTESGSVMGKIRYMSPEQISGEPLDGRSDLFALAVILWELLAGEPLWPGDNPGAVADQVRNFKIEPPSRRQREVPAELDRIVMRGLERARDARPARASELARDLAAWLAQAAPSLTREDVGTFVQEVVPRADGEPLVLAHAPTVLTPERERLPPSATPVLSPPTAPAAETRLQKRATSTEAQASTRPTVAPRARAGWIVGSVGAVLLGGAIAAWRLARPAAPARIADAGPTDAAPAASSGDGAASVSPEERLRLAVELEALPRAESTWRGVASEDFLAILSALDAALCATPAGAREPLLPAAARARVEAERLLPETMAVGRYLFTVGELPPKVAVALQAFLRSHAAWAPAGGSGLSWSLARLGVLVAPGDAKARLDVIRQNGALAAWREPGRDRALPFAELCERAAAVEAYATRAPGPRAEALRRFQRATPPELPADDAGLRYTVSGAERDEAAGTLLVHLKLTNTASDDKPLPLAQLRLAGLETAPSVDPPAAHLGPGQVRELRLGFSGLTDDIAEAAVLVVRPGVELQAYSEALR